jgi:hypothetical protein
MAYLDFFVRQIKRAKVTGSQVKRMEVRIQIKKVNCHHYWDDEAVLIGLWIEEVQVVIVRYVVVVLDRPVYVLT